MTTASLPRALARMASLAGVVGLAVVSTAAAQRVGTIRGTVTIVETHSPISGARVTIRSPERMAISDDRGSYTLRDVPAGRYTVYTSAVGRKPDSSQVT